MQSFELITGLLRYHFSHFRHTCQYTTA